jgi:hypothetical protein
VINIYTHIYIYIYAYTIPERYMKLINEKSNFFLGSLVGLASVMTDAQTAFDNCALENCPTELAAPRLREVMSYAPLRKVALAIKGVGSQGDGTVQVSLLFFSNILLVSFVCLCSTFRK